MEGGAAPPKESAAAVQAAAEALLRSREEFPIQVVGAQTTPYAAVVAELDAEKRQFLLKLIRPLPHELPEDTRFRATFGVGGERFEALLAFRGREAYLQYRFDWPEVLRPAGRRLHKRYPFRPRERVFVVAQDGGLPGLGIAGPLVDLSLGGLAMRLDRVMRLDDGLRLRADTALFERGKPFPMVSIQGLPGVTPGESLHAHAVLAHAAERGGGIQLAFEFTHLSAPNQRELTQALARREEQTRPKALPTGSGAHRTSAVSSSAEDTMEAPLPEQAEEVDATPPVAGPLRRLARRTLRLGLAMAPGEPRRRLLTLLSAEGYGRIECLDELRALKAATSREPASRRPALLLVDLALGGDPSEPLAALRVLERESEAWNGIPALVRGAEDDPALRLGRLPCLHEGPEWPCTLDARAGLDALG